MKKALAVILILALTISMAFAYQNIYNAHSIEYRILMALSKMSQTELPNPTSGISGDQMMLLISALDEVRLDKDELELLESLKKMVGKPSMLLKYPSGISIEGRLFAQPQAFASINDKATRWDWVVGNLGRKSILTIGADLYFGNLAFGTVDIDMLKDFDSYRFHGLEINAGGDWDAYKPYRAFASIGTGMFNFEL